MKEFLQGKWLGHPLHPIMVNLPTGLWPAAMVFDLIVYSGRLDSASNEALATASFFAIAAGLLSTLSAIPTGLADWWDVKPDKPAWKIGVLHLTLNAFGTAVWLTNLAVRWSDPQSSVSTTALTLSIVGTLLLAVAAYLGGFMVYEYGVGIARHSKKKWRAIAQAGGAKLPPEK